MPVSFGPDWQRELWASPYRLRFELSFGAGESYIAMFSQAYDRARKLARAALSYCQPFGVIAAIPNPSSELGATRLGWEGDAFEILEAIGVVTSPCAASWQGYVYPEDEADEDVGKWEHRAVQLNWEQADVLLWSNIACDIGVAPRAPILAKLVDPARSVTVNAYDDRGMDVTSIEPAAIGELYDRFDAWLLDFDRPRMSVAFDRRGA